MVEISCVYRCTFRYRLTLEEAIACEWYSHVSLMLMKLHVLFPFGRRIYYTLVLLLLRRHRAI